MDRWMDRLSERWVNRQVDSRQAEKKTSTYLYSCLCSAAWCVSCITIVISLDGDQRLARPNIIQQLGVADYAKPLVNTEEIAGCFSDLGVLDDWTHILVHSRHLQDALTKASILWHTW